MRSIKKVGTIVLAACLFAIGSVAQEKPKPPAPSDNKLEVREHVSELVLEGELLRDLEKKSLDALGLSLHGLGPSLRSAAA